MNPTPGSILLALLDAARKRQAELAREVEAATEDVERLRAALNTCSVLHDFWVQAYRSETPQYVSCACGEVFEAESASHAFVDWHAHVIDEQVKAALTALSGVPKPVTEAVIERTARASYIARREAEIKAEALREAADAMRRAKDPGHWNLRDPFDPETSYSPDVWLERRAVLLAKEGDQ